MFEREFQHNFESGCAFASELVSKEWIGGSPDSLPMALSGILGALDRKARQILFPPPTAADMEAYYRVMKCPVAGLPWPMPQNPWAGWEIRSAELPQPIWTAISDRGADIRITRVYGGKLRAALCP